MAFRTAPGPSRRSLLRGILIRLLIAEATLTAAFENTCRSDGIRLCRVLRVPDSEIRILPPGVVELSGFRGTCSLECLEHLKSASCREDPATRASFLSACRALACWAGVVQTCGSVLSARACTSECRDAIKSSVCKGAEEVFPEYARYREAMRPGSGACASRTCTSEYISRGCEGYNSDARTLPVASLCSQKCYRSLQQEPCKRARILIQQGSTSAPWDHTAPSSELCSSSTNNNSSSSSDDDGHKQQRTGIEPSSISTTGAIEARGPVELQVAELFEELLAGGGQGLLLGGGEDIAVSSVDGRRETETESASGAWSLRSILLSTTL